MKPNFNNEMTELLLRQEHRDDDEAWGIFLDRRSGWNCHMVSTTLDEEGVRIMEEAFRKKIQEIELGRPPVD